MKHSYYITGIAGTGKSTVARELRKHGFAVYDTDYIAGLCHWRHKDTRKEATYNTGVGKDWLDTHEWVCDEDKLKELLTKDPEKETIVVGMIANQENFFKAFDKIFLLYCSEETLITRLNTRDEGNNFAKDKSEQEHLLSWVEDFQERVKKLGAIPINTDAPIEEVVNNIRSKIN